MGKSSLINALCGKKELARVSKQPGKTQYLNYYLIDDNWHMVDLPGYGYAKISKKQRDAWDRNSKKYFLERKQLVCVFLLIDANVPPQKNDVEFQDWMVDHEVPFSIVFTKVDRKKGKVAKEVIKKYKSLFLAKYEKLPTIFETSSLRGEGMPQIVDFIDEINELFYQETKHAGGI